MRSFNRVFAILMLVFVLHLLVSMTAGLGATFLFYQDRMVPGVLVNGLPLGGMKKGAALSYLEKNASMPDKVTFQDRDEAYPIALEDLNPELKTCLAVKHAEGYKQDWQYLLSLLQAVPSEKNISIPLEVSSSSLFRAIQEIQEYVEEEPEDAYWHIEEGVPILRQEQEGIRLNLQETYNVATEKLARGKVEIDLKTEYLEPEVNTSDLPDFHQLKGRYVTPLDVEDKGKLQNLRVASDNIHGLVLEAGEKFSFNNTIGNVTAEEGYKEAMVIQNNKFVPGIGGGICQLSSNLYMTALYSELDIIERHNHSRPVSYLPMGFDATVASGLLDLQFKNNHEFPLMVTVIFHDDSLETCFYGAPYDHKRDVEIVSDTVATIEPSVLTRPDPSLPQNATKKIQDGKEGYRVKTFKTVKENGDVVEETLVSEDIYRPVNEILRVGVTAAGEKN